MENKLTWIFNHINNMISTFMRTFLTKKKGVLGKYSSLLYIPSVSKLMVSKPKLQHETSNHRGLKRRVWCHISQAQSIS